MVTKDKVAKNGREKRQVRLDPALVADIEGLAARQNTTVEALVEGVFREKHGAELDEIRETRTKLLTGSK